MKPLVLLLAAVLPIAGIAQTSPASVAVPRLVNFSGTLRDATGKSLTGTQALTLSIYPDPDSRTPLWQEKQNVQTDETGHYTVQLGAATASGIPLDLFTSGTPLWLGVAQQAGGPEQQRVLLVSAPYALKAADAETLAGRPASDFVTRDAITSNTAAANSRDSFRTASTIPCLVTPHYIPIWTDSTYICNSALYQSGTNIGLNTT